MPSLVIYVKWENPIIFYQKKRRKASLTSKHVFTYNSVNPLFIKASAVATELYTPHALKIQKRYRLNLVGPWRQGNFLQTVRSGRVGLSLIDSVLQDIDILRKQLRIADDILIDLILDDRQILAFQIIGY